jgi:hypothetical protein
MVELAEIHSTKMTSDPVPVYFMESGSRFRGVLLPLELGYITNYFT